LPDRDGLKRVSRGRQGTVTASLIMRQLASYRRQNGVAAAQSELGRLGRTRFTLDWISDPGLRRTTGQELNKARHAQQPGAGGLHSSSGRDPRSGHENQQHRASGLNFIVTAIILWNTRYLLSVLSPLYA
jgi:TnpA family transposase